MDETTNFLLWFTRIESFFIGFLFVGLLYFRQELKHQRRMLSDLIRKADDLKWELLSRDAEEIQPKKRRGRPPKQLEQKTP